ncbi:MAG: SGNH/GDSL hydrolase family protein [Parasporobacterium sp.]|nr:SGNH/GDSL hydrolase family protein [Parasporobacterium sp.]
MKEMTASNFIKKGLLLILLLLLLSAATVFIFDPFYHYHKPLWGLKAVLNEKEYQVPGTLDHFEYNAVIAGSSVAENYNNRWFDEAFDCTSVKAIRSYGAVADLCYFIERGYENSELKYVFLNLDPSSIVSESYLTFEETGSPLYLYDDNPFNDVKYLFNKDILFERIPYMLASSLTGDYDEGTSYNWGQWKTFSEDDALSHYVRRKTTSQVKPADSYLDNCRENISLIEDIIKAHPETEFYIFIPPYSVLWWDTINRDGDVPGYIEAEKYALKTLAEYENVSLYNFQNAEDIVFDLNNYMDSLHFSPEINKYMCDCLKEGKYKLRDDSEIESSLEKVLKYTTESTDYVEAHYMDRINTED